MKFEEALKKLEKIVEKLENSEINLDESIKLYEQGQELIKFCKDYLSRTEEKIEEVKIK